MEKAISTEDFQKILKKKERQILYTPHAVQRAKLRKIITEDENEINRFENDIKKKPDIIVEQDSEISDERKFKLYYRFERGGFLTYILAMDGEIRVITVYRTSKTLQKKIYKYRKRR